MQEVEAGRTEERRMLAASVADFARRATDMARVRGWRGVAPGFDRGLWREMAAMGWTGLLLPEHYGGAGLGFQEMAEVATGLARTLLPEPLVPCAVLAPRVLLHCENVTLGAELLPEIAAGESIAALAWQEVAGDLGSHRPATSARYESGQIRLQGSKRFVAGAAGADGFVVSASADNRLFLVWVPAATAGLTVQLEALADGRFAGRLELAGAAVPERNVLAEGEVAQAALARAIDEASAMAAAELQGVMSRALEMTLDYLRTRVQFGRAIGSFQALQHRAVDLYVQEQLASVALADCARALDEQPLDAATAAAVSRAKARCSDAAALITRQAIQMHGAIGFTEEADVGLYVKRALTLCAWLGNSTYHRRRYARLVPDEVQ